MRVFKRICLSGFKQDHKIILFIQMTNPPATARHERAGRMMSFFIH